MQLMIFFKKGEFSSPNLYPLNVVIVVELFELFSICITDWLILEKFWFRLDNNFLEELNFKQFLPESDLKEVSVRARGNLIYICGGGHSLTVIEIPRIFNEGHLQAELLLLKADVTLKSIRYPYLLDQMHQYYREHVEDDRENQTFLSQILQESLDNIQHITLRMRGSRRKLETKPSQVEDRLSLTLPYQHTFPLGQRAKILIENSQGLLVQVVNQLSLLPWRDHRYFRSILPNITKIVQKCGQYLSCSQIVHLLSSFINCSDIDHNKHLLRIMGILTLSTVKSFLSKQRISKSDLAKIIISLEKFSNQIDLIYMERSRQHKLLFSSFLYVYNFIHQSEDVQLKGK